MSHLRANKHHVRLGIEWLKKAQDATPDGGVSAWYSLINGWQDSYIETTGYIINTFFDCAEYLNDPSLKKRAIEMADFLISMQHSSGGYRTSVPSKKPDSPPTVFNTGQDLIGLTRAYQETKNKKYLKSAVLAADFLVKIQEPNGAWVKNTYGQTSHAYHSRVSWGLLLVSELVGKKKQQVYKTAAKKNLNWVVKQQQKNGWYKKAELPKPNIQLPYTHTISYTIEGLLWSGLILKNKKYLKSAQKAAETMLNYYLKQNFMPGTFNEKWQSRDRYSCLTGDAQLSLVWLELYKLTKNRKFFIGAEKINNFLKSKQVKSHFLINTHGGLAGSWPIEGDLLRNKGYCRLAYLNWSVKFFIDALILEDKLKTL